MLTMQKFLVCISDFVVLFHQTIRLGLANEPQCSPLLLLQMPNVPVEFGNLYFPGTMQAKPGYMGRNKKLVINLPTVVLITVSI